MDEMMPEMGKDMGESAPGAYEICIAVDETGQMSVGVEGAEYQPAQSIKDALIIAAQIYQADGQMPESNEGEQAAAQSAFDQSRLNK